MIGLIQRVTSAKVTVAQKTVGEIESGILLFLGIQKEDCAEASERLARRILDYRIFPDANGNMNLSLRQVDGGLLVVSQFTLAANTDTGVRPSFSQAAPSSTARPLYEAFVAHAHLLHSKVETGIFGADMQVSLCNDGPVTFILQN